jgi:serine/threonine protein kinase
LNRVEIRFFKKVKTGFSMNRYKVTKQLGDGTYGSVLKAVNRQTGEVVR